MANNKAWPPDFYQKAPWPGLQKGAPFPGEGLPLIHDKFIYTVCEFLLVWTLTWNQLALGDATRITGTHEHVQGGDYLLELIWNVTENQFISLLKFPSRHDIKYIQILCRD